MAGTLHSIGPTARILVIRLRRLGDILRVTPVLRAIRQTYPWCQLNVLVSAGFEAALVGNPHIDQLLIARRGLRPWLGLTTRCRQRRYDVVVDLQSSPRSVSYVAISHAPLRIGWRKRWLRDRAYNVLVSGWDAPVYFSRNALRMTAGIGVPLDSAVRLELPVSAADRAQAAALFAAAGITQNRPVIAVSVVAREAQKQWPAERYVAVADHLVRQLQAQLVLTHGPGELEQVRAVVAQMQAPPVLWEHATSTLSQLGALYERCQVWVGNDGGPKHVAAAVGCPSLTILRRSDLPITVDAEDMSQIAVAPDADHGPVPVAAVTADRVYNAAVTLLQRRETLLRTPAGMSC